MIEKLDWDSKFFRMSVGKMDWNSLSNDLKNSNLFDLIYIYSENKIPENELSRLNGSVQLVDEKITYTKKIISIKETSTNIKSFNKDEKIPSSLYDLAIQSGYESRFVKDIKFPKILFEKLYKRWIEESVKRTISSEVYIFKTKNIIYGFITLGIKFGIPNIGLIAVNPLEQSTGIGKSLLQAAENWAYSNMKSEEISVVTQKSNNKACKFYENNLYTIENINYVYHWWNK